jgi:hypothetical protein
MRGITRPVVWREKKTQLPEKPLSSSSNNEYHQREKQRERKKESNLMRLNTLPT